MNMLAIEIGNSHASIGTVEDWGVRQTMRVDAADLASTGSHVAAAWSELPGGKPRVIVIGSVQPEFLRQIRGQIEQAIDTQPLVIREQVPLPMEMAIDNPETVGVDRICAAAAAYERIHAPVAVADFGTAITIDCVSADGVFLGGAILPGLTTSARALHRQTASLPMVEIRRPMQTYGRNTAEAISNGVFLGAVGALREIVERYATALGRWPHLVACGGDAQAIAQECDFIDSVVPDLGLQGIVLAYRTHLRDVKAGGQVL